MTDRSLLVDETIELVASWLEQSEAIESRADRAVSGPLRELIEDPDGVAFAMRFIDRVARPESQQVAAAQLRALVADQALPAFLSPLDRTLLKAGAFLAPKIPRIVMPLAERRMRKLVDHLIVDARPKKLANHLAVRRDQGFAQNVNLLGEEVLGEAEAQRRLDATFALIDDPNVDYVSVKLSSVVPQLNHWDWDGCLQRVNTRLTEVAQRAASSQPPTFLNLDMETYLDLELTSAAFRHVYAQPDLQSVEAGIVLQAYLPDSFAALQELTEWATQRKAAGGAGIKIRLVKGANLAMETVEASLHGWEQAPYGSKAEVDANYKRCLDWLLVPDRMRAVRIGVASHNLFDVAWAHLLSNQRGVSDRVQFEMLQGMAPNHARVINSETADELLLYTPIVDSESFDVAISYLFRRLEENAAPQNFIRSLFSLRRGSPEFTHHATGFRNAVASRWDVGDEPQRSQVRPAVGAEVGTGNTFANEPDSDPALETNRKWAQQVLDQANFTLQTPMTTSIEEIDRFVQTARHAQQGWSATAAQERRLLIRAVGDQLARRRGDLIATMVHEAHKTFAQADTEISEAIDFAVYYADEITRLTSLPGATFEPLGTVAIVPPWNFPVAIAAGGVLAALAAGNSVILKPAPETPHCCEILAECLWQAGVPADVFQFVRTPDDAVGQRLVTTVDGVILTGASETAQMFMQWRPDMRLFAETSGKNALIITPQADIDLAVRDLVASAFGHGGQKCSAASLAICVGSLYESPRFRRQLIDAVKGLSIGAANDLGSDVGPLISIPAGKLARALDDLDPGEEWLVQPHQDPDNPALWSPGVRLGVQPGSWFHQTECFGPVLGIMAAPNLDAAIAMQNATEFGLTGGIHTLDAQEVEHWLEQVEVGNAYVNRAITGAIVQRQPFGGWKQSSVGPGAKAGGPNYVAQLGTWSATGPLDADASAASDEAAWAGHFSLEHDPTGLAGEANIFRYRPLKLVGVRVGPGSVPAELECVRAAAQVAGCALVISDHTVESDAEFAESLRAAPFRRVRVLGDVSTEIRQAANAAHVHLADDPVTNEGALELRHYVREQAISRTMHRFGNLISVSDGLDVHSVT